VRATIFDRMGFSIAIAKQRDGSVLESNSGDLFAPFSLLITNEAGKQSPAYVRPFTLC
jgi:hypothetical protein